MDQQTAQPTEPVKVPATVAAVESRDFKGFRDASLAQRSGKPLPDVDRPTATVDGEPTDAGRALNANQRRRAREQQRINEGIRAGVEAATKKQQEELAKQPKPEPAARVEPVAAAPIEKVEAAKPVTVPEYKRFAAMSDAPKVQDFDSLDEHSAAMALFVADKRHEEREAKARTDATQGERTKALIARDDAYRERVAPKGDTTFLAALSDPVKALRPVESLKAGEPVSALNVLASKIVESEQVKELLQHLSDHPKELERFSTLRTPDAVFVEFGKLVGSLDPPKETAPRPKLVSDASRPVTQFGARNAAPADAEMNAVKKRDFRAFRAARLAKEQAKRAS